MRVVRQPVGLSRRWGQGEQDFFSPIQGLGEGGGGRRDDSDSDLGRAGWSNGGGWWAARPEARAPLAGAAAGEQNGTMNKKNRGRTGKKNEPVR